MAAKLRAAGVALVLAAAFLSVAGVRGARAGARCHKVSGRIQDGLVASGCTSPVGLCTAGTLTGDGLLDGTTLNVVDDLAPSAGMPASVAPSTLSLRTTLTLSTSSGQIAFAATGLLDTAAGLLAFVAQSPSGTGQFEGATGQLFVTGHATANGFESDVSGEICVE